MIARFKLLTLMLSVVSLAAPALACDASSCPRSCAKEGVYFKGLYDNTAVDQSFQVAMVANGMKIQKAGEKVDGSGHFHIIIDGGYVKAGDVVPKDATHLHYGKGQSEATLKLTPGDHTLTLQLADGHHVSYGEDWSRTVQVYVKP